MYLQWYIGLVTATSSSYLQS